MKQPTPTTLGQLQSEIPKAERLVEDGARLLEEQRARVAQVEGPNSKKLLRTMEETQALHELHLKTLRQELAQLSKKE